MFLENITEARRKQRRATRLSKLKTSPSITSPSSPQASQIEDRGTNEAGNDDKDEMHYTHVEEHLQLSLVEGFFLAYGLGCLEIMDGEKVNTPSNYKAKSDRVLLIKRDLAASFHP
jgi:hypothetical protein